MRCVDVNVLVNAHRVDGHRHDEHRDWLEWARRADEPLGLLDAVLSGFLRVVTHPRVFREPTPLPDALAFVESIRSGPNAMRVQPGPRHWPIFRGLIEAAEARGNLVADAFLAATCIEHGATWYSSDRDFARFDGLSWRHPLDP